MPPHPFWDAGCAMVALNYQALLVALTLSLSLALTLTLTLALTLALAPARAPPGAPCLLGRGPRHGRSRLPGGGSVSGWVRG